MKRFLFSKPILLFLKLLFTAGLFWLVLHDVELSELKAIISTQKMEGVLVALLLMGMQILLGALRWQKILVALSGHKEKLLSLAEIIKLYYISVFFYACLPGIVGGDVVRVWLIKSDRIPLSMAIYSVIIDRVIALLALVLLLLMTMHISPALAAFSSWMWLPGLALLIVAGFALLKPIERLLAPYTHQKPICWLLHFIGCMRMLGQYKFASLGSLFYAVVAHASYCLAAYALAYSMGIALTPIQAMTLIPLVMLAITLPISFGGWGVREAGMVGVLGLVGVSQGQALILSVQLGLLGILIALPAGLLWLTRRSHKRTVL